MVLFTAQDMLLLSFFFDQQICMECFTLHSLTSVLTLFQRSLTGKACWSHKTDVGISYIKRDLKILKMPLC